MVTLKELAITVLALGAVATILLNIHEMWRARKESRKERRRFGIAFYLMATLFLVGLLVTGNGDMLLNRNSNLK